MEYKKTLFLEKLHALIEFVWDVPWDKGWEDSLERRNSIDFYACVLYDVAHHTPPKEEDYAAMHARHIGIHLARSLFRGWSNGPLKGALETFCLLVNYSFIREIPSDIMEKKEPLPDMRNYKEDILLSLYGLSRIEDEKAANLAGKRIL